MQATNNRKINRLSELELRAALQKSCEHGGCTMDGDRFSPNCIHAAHLAVHLEKKSPGSIVKRPNPRILDGLIKTIPAGDVLKMAKEIFGKSPSKPKSHKPVHPQAAAHRAKQPKRPATAGAR